MEREKFMQEARLIAHRILEGKENGIMNLVQRAWAEGKRNAEVETLRAAIDEALDRREPKVVMGDEVYPTWENWLTTLGVQSFNELSNPIPADIAQKLGIEPKETDRGT